MNLTKDQQAFLNEAQQTPEFKAGLEEGLDWNKSQKEDLEVDQAVEESNL